MSIIYNIWRADFYERVRRRNYLVTLLVMTLLTLFFFPQDGALYATVLIKGYRGIYNSAWMGTTLAILNLAFLPIISFYLVKNAIANDRQTKTCELIAATVVKKHHYILGKWLSNLMLLVGIVIVMTITSMLLQVWFGEDYAVDVFAFILPQIIFVLPLLATIAAVALLFESIAFLRGGLGNVIYFFLWIGVMVAMLKNGSGIEYITEQIKVAVELYDPDNSGRTVIGVSFSDEGIPRPVKSFVWTGIIYSVEVFKTVLVMMTVNLISLIAAILFFDRFKKSSISNTNKTVIHNLLQKLFSLLHPIARLFEIICNVSAFTRLMRQELLLLIRGASSWWYLIMISLCITQLIVPVDILRLIIIPATWLLCVLTFSPMGHRELSENTEQLIFCCVSPLKQQFPAQLIAGFVVALMMVSAALLRFLLIGEFFSALMLITGALFISSLALACGALTRTSRTFEIIFTMIWYIGPMQQSPFDFVGVVPAISQAADAPLMFFVVSMMLIWLAFQGRKWQINY